MKMTANGIAHTIPKAIETEVNFHIEMLTRRQTATTNPDVAMDHAMTSAA